MPSELADRFLALHVKGQPLLQPNAWNVGSAVLLQSLGFEAVATTSSGFAATLGRIDGKVSREEALAHGAALAAALHIPVAADTENGFADDPAGVAETVGLAASAGLAGCSIEDWSGSTIYDAGLARERIEAAAAAARDAGIVLTARAENHIHGVDDLDDTIRRLQAYQEAGADALFAPGIHDIARIRAITSAVDLPLNVLATAAAPPVAELAEAGVARISVGGSFAYAALGALIDAANELRDSGTYGWWDKVAAARTTVREAFAAR